MNPIWFVVLTWNPMRITSNPRMVTAYVISSLWLYIFVFLTLIINNCAVSICDRIWENRPYGDYCWFELWAKIYTRPTYHGFSDYHSTKKYYPLPSSWRWSDAHTSPHLFRRSVSFGPLVPPLIACNGEMFTWRQCYYGNGSGSTSVSVFQQRLLILT